MRHAPWMLACALAPLAACVAVKPAETLHLMRLAPRFPPAAAAPARQGVSVGPVAAGGAIGRKSYFYIDRAAPAELRQAATLVWDEAPSQVMERALVDGLKASGREAGGPEVLTLEPLRLTTRLERFEEHEGGGAPAAASVAWRATVIESATKRLVVDRRYCAEVPIGGAEPSDRAHAFEAAVVQTVSKLAADLTAGGPPGGADGC